MGRWSKNRADAVVAVGEVARTHQYTLLQDAFHINDANFDFAYSKDVVKELSKQGVKHFCIEADGIIQVVIDKYSNGEVSRKEFISFAKENFFTQQSRADRARTAENLADLIDTTKQEGIKVHCIDYSGPYACLQEAVKVTAPIAELESVGELKAAFKNMSKLDFSKADNPQIAKYFSNFAKNTLKAIDDLNLPDSTDLTDPNFRKKMFAGLYDERASCDLEIANNIKKACGNEKAVICIGILHGKQLKDLDEYLGNEKVGKALLTPNSGTYKELMSWGSNYELPATIIYTDACSRWPGHQVKVWQAEARAIGDEINYTEFKDTKYSQLDLPSETAIRNAPKAEIVRE